MGRFKLSFDRGNPIAVAVDKDNKILHTIRVTDNEDDSMPDIDVDNIFNIMKNDDIDNIGRVLKLSRLEKKVLKRALKNKSKSKLNPKLQGAFDLTIDTLHDKLKNELEFDNDVRVLPTIGHKDKPFDRHIFIAGASNSGKSFFAGDLLRFDNRLRPITLISKLTDDPAFQHIKAEPDSDDDDGRDMENKKSEITGGKLDTEDVPPKRKKKRKKKDKNKRLKQFMIKDESDVLNLPNKEDLSTDKGHIMLFDDIDTFSPEIADILRRYQNDLLETARKSNISVISTSHGLKRYQRTRTNLNEAEWVVLFPSSNQMLSNKFLKDNLGLIKSERDRIIQKGAKNHYMAVKTSSPLAVIHERGIILL